MKRIIQSEKASNIVYFFKRHYHILLFIGLLLYGFSLRVGKIDSFPDSNDLQRDYLIANHIASYGELPDSGPNNTVFGKAISPAYYYAAAIPVFFYQDPLALAVACILLHLALGLIVFLVSEKMFDRKSAVIAAILWVSSHAILVQATLFSQVQIAALFVGIGYYLLVLSLRREKASLLSASALAFVLGAFFHSSVIALAPGVLLCSFYIMRDHRSRFKMLASVVFGAAALLLLSYRALFSIGWERFWDTFAKGGEIAANLFSNWSDFLGSLFGLSQSYIDKIEANRQFSIGPRTDMFLGADDLRLAGFLGLAAAFILIVLYFRSPAVELDRKKRVIACLGISVLYIFVMSLLRMPERTMYNFMPLYLLWLFILAESVTAIRVENKAGHIFRIAAVLIIAASLAHDPSYYFDVSRPDLRASSLEGSAVETRIREMMTDEARKDLYFFDAFEYVHMGNTRWIRSSSYLWNILEKKSGRLVKIADAGRGVFHPLGSVDVIFLRCPTIEEKPCLSFFESIRTDFKIAGRIYGDSRIFLYEARLKTNGEF